MANYVLVHGAWHGGWCWRKLSPLLRAKGHEVFTPTLTGLGERVHLLTPDVGLDTHVQDIVNVMNYEDLRDVILVGHSYGGMVVTGVGDRSPERIKPLVYLDAMVPVDGDSIVSLISTPGAPPPAWNLPGALSVPVPETNFGVEQPDEVAWLRAKMVPQPMGAMTRPSQLSSNIETRSFPLTFILAAGKDGAGPSPGFKRVADRVRHDSRWTLNELNTGHDVMVTMPNELADILLAMA